MGPRVAIVNLDELNAAFKSGDEVNFGIAQGGRALQTPCDHLKVLGNGELKKKLKITAHRFSASALEKIKAAGGEAVVCRPQAGVRKSQRPPPNQFDESSRHGHCRQLGNV